MASQPAVHRLASGLKYAATSALLLLGAACSNPLSGGNAEHIQNFHSKNVNCDELNFQSGTITVDEIRSLTHCLNSNAEIDAIETLLDAVPDTDLQPLSDLVNDLMNKQPKVLYALRESYKRAETSGDLKAIETTLTQILANSSRNAAALKVFQKVSTPLINAVFDQKLEGNLSSVYVVSKSKAFQRLGSEYLAGNGLKTLLLASAHYLNTPGARPVSKLYAYLNDNSLDARWLSMIAGGEQARTQNLAHIFNWLFSNGHYETFSTGVRHALKDPIKCFDGSKTIINPLSVVADKIKTMNSQEAKVYFSHDIKNLYVTAQGYCEFPYGFSSLIDLVDDSTKIAGFDELYTLVKPLLLDPDFVDFTGSEASAKFVKELSPLVDRHLFEDFFTLVTLHLKNPFTNDGAKIAALLDNLLKPVTDSDISSLVDFLAPVFTPTESYGGKVTKAAYRISYGFPEVTFTIEPALRTSLIASVHNIVLKSELAHAMDLIASLINQTKLDGIIDQSIVYLANLFERGHFDYPVAQVQDPATVTLPSVSYLLSKFSDPVSTLSTAAACQDVNLDWIFSQYSTASSADYLARLDAFQTCINPNQTFASVRDLVNYSISKASYNFVLKAQKKVLDTMFKTNSNLFLDTVDDFLASGQSDSDTIRKILNVGSLSLGLVKDSLLAKTELRKTIADFIKDPASYQALAELTGPKPTRTRSSAPTLDLVNLTTINAIVTKDRRLNNSPVEDAVKAIMMEYCPSLDTTRGDCDIDSDQVALYQQSPKLLYQQIAREELASSQSWLHPVLSQGWTHQNGTPTQVSEMEFHLNPALHLFRKSPQAPQGLMNALTRIKKDHMSLASFLKDRATRVLLIPYVYQVPNFPNTSTKEYHDRIRIRVLNDLDRLELIAINADFKAFNLVSNIGMGFIRDIGLAWGDVPAADRPASLGRILGRSQPKTLKAVKESIDSQLATFDSSIIQSLGNCDTRGRSALGRWIVSRTCNSEMVDVSARLFNLRFLVSLLQDELPAADGGYAGLEFLRDLFYMLYEADTDAQRDNFANGVSLNDACLQNPLNSATPNRNCQKDLLTMISRVTHLGLLHDAGIAVIQAKDNPIDAFTNLTDRVVSDSTSTTQFVNILSSDEGLTFLKDAVDYGFQSPDGTGKNLSLVTQMLSIPQGTNCLSLAFDLIPKIPHFPAQNKELINSLLSMDAENLKPWLDHWISTPSLPTPKFLNLVSQKLTPATRADTIQLLKDLTPNSATFAGYVTTVKNLPDFQNTELKKDTNSWATQFADTSLASTRSDFADWTLSPEFKQFCDVFSDATWTTKAYNFLESVNHNQDSKIFLQSCRDFLNLSATAR